MYHVINIKGIFKILSDHSFQNQNCKLKITINDSFLTENGGSTIIHFVNGMPRLGKISEHEVEICLDVSDFSSLIMGVVNFKNLYNYGLARISDIKYMDTVNKLFMTKEKPKCTTLF